MQPNEIIKVLNRPISQELPARDVTCLAHVARDGTLRSVPIAFTWNGSHRHVYDEERAQAPVATLAHRLRKRRHQ